MTVVEPTTAVVRPGDLVLIRMIAWWDSQQIQRALGGIVLSTLPLLWDLFERNTLTWRSGLFAVIAGLFASMGYRRAKSPDVITGNVTLDRANVTALVPPDLAADMKSLGRTPAHA